MEWSHSKPQSRHYQTEGEADLGVMREERGEVDLEAEKEEDLNLGTEEGQDQEKGEDLEVEIEDPGVEVVTEQ